MLCALLSGTELGIHHGLLEAANMRSRMLLKKGRGMVLHRTVVKDLACEMLGTFTGVALSLISLELHARNRHGGVCRHIVSAPSLE